MKAFRILFAIGSAIVLLISNDGVAQEKEKQKTTAPKAESAEKKSPVPVALPVYHPPLRGAPKGRVGGGTRGGTDESVVLTVLAPEQIGLTTREQPLLYWYLSRLTPDPIELTVIEDQAVKPILETRISPPAQPGIQRIRLADYGIGLKIGVEYRWFIAVVPDPNNRSKDILAGGLVERVEPSTSLNAQIRQASATQAPSIYADQGIWYEALSTLSEMIDTALNDFSLRQQRASLLQQVGLREIADVEMRAGR